MAGKKHTIAAFDFDETLITTDTLLDFLSHSFSGPIFAINMLRALPTIVLFKLRILKNDRAKERLLTIFLHDMPIARFHNLCASYCERLDTITSSVALNRVKWHQERGDEVIIISASVEGWIVPWASQHNIKTVIATKLVVDDNKLSGKLNGPNCYGQEKVNRFLDKFSNRTSYTLYMYGDGKSDQQMFDLADHSFLKTFGN